MGLGFGRPPYAPQLLLPLLLIGCAGSKPGRDSGVTPEASVDEPERDGEVDEPGFDCAVDEPAIEAGRPAALDAHAGLVSGASCDASAACRSGSCVLGTCSDWSHVMRITVDTTPDGANLRQAVTDFPLLVRLRAANLDFRQARADGADVRFMDESGRTLAYQKERWDADRGEAELWISVPRIEPNLRDNVVLMYWGNPLAASLSSGPSVFDDLECTLHMDAADDGIAAHLQDASGKGNTGNLPNRSPSLPADTKPTEGIAGPGLQLDGSNEYLTLIESAQSPQSFAISLWLRTASQQPASIAEFASDSGNRLDRLLRMDERGRIAFGVLRTNGGVVTVSSLTGYSDWDWHHVVVRSGDNGQFLFVDGEPLADNPSRSTSTNNNGTWHFGADPPPTNSGAATPPSNCFAGILDEIQLIVDREPSDDWIKLSYATQHPDKNVVSYRAVPAR